jgi:hypothetical protein
MSLWRLVVLAGLSVHCTVASAAPKDVQPVPTIRQLQGLTDEESTALLAKLEDAQRRLKAGEFQNFELLAGSIASYDMTKSSPREVFLRVPFQKIWNIKRVPNEYGLTYSLSYAPNGLGQLYWEIEVAMGFNGDVERVLMTYKPPAPV